MYIKPRLLMVHDLLSMINLWQCFWYRRESKQANLKHIFTTVLMNHVEEGSKVRIQNQSRSKFDMKSVTLLIPCQMLYMQWWWLVYMSVCLWCVYVCMYHIWLVSVCVLHFDLCMSVCHTFCKHDNHSKRKAWFYLEILFWGGQRSRKVSNYFICLYTAMVILLHLAYHLQIWKLIFSDLYQLDSDFLLPPPPILTSSTPPWSPWFFKLSCL